MQINMRLLTDLKGNERNARTHPPAQIKKLARAIREFGFRVPVLVDASGTVIAGHARVEAAKAAGLVEVPTILIDDLTPDQVRAFALADNRIALDAGWNVEILAQEFQVLGDLGFDLSLAGFEVGEIDLAFDELAQNDDVDDSVELSPATTDAITCRRGDLWKLGSHRLLCGDALNADDVSRVMNGQRADVIFVDPPYNVSIEGHVSGLGAAKHREFVQASGEMSEAEFVDFLGKALGNLAAASRDGAVMFVAMDWRHLFELLSAARHANLHQLNLCIWRKTNAGMGSLYRSQHELVLVLKNGRAPHVNTVQLGKHGRYRTNVWTYPGANTFRPDRLADLADHPTVKPVELVADAIKDVSKRGAIVLDSFAGSGTTILAAERSGRKARVLELDPGYCDVILRRYHRATGVEPGLDDSGEPFSLVARRRAERDEAA